jgi:hypothetical protein
MAWHRVGVLLPLLLAAVHAGDELTDAARRQRISRLRTRAATWYTSRKGVITKCHDCQGLGTGIERGINRGGLETGTVVTCPCCGGRCKIVQEEHYRRAFFEMMTPAHRSNPGRAQAIEDELGAARHGDGWPDAVERWQIDRVELTDATHGVVWAKLNGAKTPTPTRWIQALETNGKPDWFMYDAATDGSWPGGWKDAVAASGLEEIEWTEWFRRADEVRAKGTTTLAKVEALKVEAAKVLVVETVKIVDVTPSGEGARIVVCRLFGGPWRTSVEVGRDDLPLVREWGKWDRLTWRLRVVVDGVKNNEVRGEIIWDGPDSITWSKNPGLGGQEIDPAEPASFREWCAKFDAAGAADRPEMIRKVQGKAFVDEAKIAGLAAGQAKVQFEGGEVATFPLDDPQVAEVVKVGDTIVVARWADTFDVVAGDASRQNLRFAFAVLQRKGAPD